MSAVNFLGHEKSFVCPTCHSALKTTESGVSCTKCSASFPLKEGILDFGPEIKMQGGYGPYMMQSPLHITRYEEMREEFIWIIGANWDNAFSMSDEDVYITKHLAPANGAVLDLACGSGRWTEPIVKKVGKERVVGLDLSWAMLRAIQTNLPGPLYVRGSALCLPFADGTLGGANCSNALQLMPDPRKAILEIGRCLMPGGVFTCFTYMKSANLACRYFQEQHCRAFNIRIFSEDDIRTWVGEAGMEVVDITSPNSIFLFTARKK